ncbi:FecR family protein [Pseudidiomarina salilacus]|uniref:FecR family protein n=1 Tax=Pseudidiomarina salilacus TaxID=3384452 RepID=UPI003984CE72
MTKEIRASAVHWVTRLHSGELSAREEDTLRQWRSIAAHEQEFQAALAAWDLSAELYVTAPAKRTAWRSRSWWLGGSLAACVASLAIALNLGWQLLQVAEVPTVADTAHTPAQPATIEDKKTLTASTAFRITELKALALEAQPRTFTTAVGEVTHIQLADGSKVSLNTDSEIRVTMQTEQRLVELVHGEAFFDVAPNPERPFVIATNGERITVLGTQFNVRKRRDEATMQVAVVEGKVAVKRQLVETTKSPEIEQEKLLLAGDIGSFSSNAEVIQQNQHAKASERQTWRRGIVTFDNQTLATVVHELNRYRVRKIQLATAEVGDYRISGVFHLRNGDAILDALSTSLPIHIDQHIDRVEIHPR